MALEENGQLMRQNIRHHEKKMKRRSCDKEDSPEVTARNIIKAKKSKDRKAERDGKHGRHWSIHQKHASTVYTCTTEQSTDTPIHTQTNVWLRTRQGGKNRSDQILTITC